MKKYIVLSVNDNPDYLYYTPLTVWAWRKFGWEPILMHQTIHHVNGFVKFGGQSVYCVSVAPIDGYRSDTVTQIARLYGALTTPSDEDCYLMTGDIDMIPLSDYWRPNEDAVTVYGHDLTGFTHAPICYIGMPRDTWRTVMKLREDYPIETWIKRDLDNSPQAKDPDFYKYWFTDQDVITGYLNIYGKERIKFINRGQYSNGYAVGRVDRGAWSLNHSQFIDAHLFQQLYHKNNQDKFDKTMELLTSIWPDEDFQWFIDYTNEFRKLTGHA